MTTSLGHGNYNAAFASLKIHDWRGFTLQNNLTWSRNLGTGGVIQATSQEAVVDPFNFNTQYGTEPSDRKLVNTTLFVYQPPFYRGQQGLLGHVLGGWTTSFVFAAGSGAPLFCATPTSFVGNGYSGGQEFGGADGNNLATDGNCINTGSTPSASVHNINGVFTAFGNPTAVYNNLRPLVLGFDKIAADTERYRALPYWNLNIGDERRTYTSLNGSMLRHRSVSITS